MTNHREKAEQIWDNCQPDMFPDKEESIGLIEKILSITAREAKREVLESVEIQDLREIAAYQGYDDHVEYFDKFKKEQLGGQNVKNNRSVR